MTDEIAKTEQGLAWEGACRSTRKAIDQGMLLEWYSAQLLLEMQDLLLRGDAQAIAQCMAVMAGPVALPDLKLAHGAMAMAGNELAEHLMCAIVDWHVSERSRVGDEDRARRLDVQSLKRSCIGWIESGMVRGADVDCDANKIGRLIARSVKKEGGSVAGARLSVLAVMAPVVEVLCFVDGLSEDYLSVLKQAQQAGQGERGGSGEEALKADAPQRPGSST